MKATRIILGILVAAMLAGFIVTACTPVAGESWGRGMNLVAILIYATALVWPLTLAAAILVVVERVKRLAEPVRGAVAGTLIALGVAYPVLLGLLVRWKNLS